MNKRKTGGSYEKKAAEYLERQGVAILERNFRCKSGEIDLIGMEDGVYVFVEVKYRADLKSGYPEEAVDGRKRRTICRTADHYRMKNRLGDGAPCRFDVVAIMGEEVFWYRNAFEYSA